MGQELREDLDVILTMLMQDAGVGAGMLKCLSCERPVGASCEISHMPRRESAHGKKVGEVIREEKMLRNVGCKRNRQMRVPCTHN
jgi:hypothetical protein